MKIYIKIILLFFYISVYYNYFHQYFRKYGDYLKEIEIFKVNITNYLKKSEYNNFYDKISKYILNNSLKLQNKLPFHYEIKNILAKNETFYLTNIIIFSEDFEKFNVKLLYHKPIYYENENIPNNKLLLFSSFITSFSFIIFHLLFIIYVIYSKLNKIDLLPMNYKIFYHIFLYIILTCGFSYKLFISQKEGYDLNSDKFTNIQSLLVTIGSLLRNFNANWGKINSINSDVENFNFMTVFNFFQGNLFATILYSYINLSDFMNKVSYFNLERRELLYILFFLVILIFDNYTILKKLKKLNKNRNLLNYMFDSKNITVKNIIEVLEIKYYRMNSHFLVSFIHLLFRFIYFLFKIIKFKTKLNYLKNIAIFEYFIFFLILQIIYFPKKVNNLYFMDLNFIEKLEIKTYKCEKLKIKSNIEKVVFNEKEVIKKKQILFKEKSPIIVVNPIFNKKNNSDQYLYNMKIGYINIE